MTTKTNRKYEHLFYTHDPTARPGVPQHEGKLVGVMTYSSMQNKDAPHWWKINLVYKPGVGWGDGEPLGAPGSGAWKTPHKHAQYEMFGFFGTDPDHPDDLGGTVEYWIGEGDEAEMYTITKPTTILIPPHTPHLPEYFKEVHHPFITVVVLDYPVWDYGAIEWLHTYPKGFEHYLLEQPYQR